MSTPLPRPTVEHESSLDEIAVSYAAAIKLRHPEGQVDHFRVGRVDKACKYLWVDVVVFATRRRMQEYPFGIYSEPVRDDHKAAFVPMLRHDISANKGCIGQIVLSVARKIELYALHEAHHAAFHLSRYRRRWDVSDESEREEFIVRAGEYIFECVQKRLREKNFYKNHLTTVPAPVK